MAFAGGDKTRARKGGRDLENNLRESSLERESNRGRMGKKGATKQAERNWLQDLVTSATIERGRKLERGSGKRKMRTETKG